MAKEKALAERMIGATLHRVRSAEQKQVQVSSNQVQVSSNLKQAQEQSQA